MELEETTGGCTFVMRIALAYASQETVHLSDMLSELTFPQLSSVQKYEDNRGALELSGTTAFSSSTKHSCTRYHFLRELVVPNKIIVSHVQTTDQLAAIFAILDKTVKFDS